MSKEKKPFRKVAMPALTKSNMLKLADRIYSDNGNQVTYTKLCDGDLCKTSGKKVMHCAIGEAYHTFVSSDHNDMVELNELQFYRSPHLTYDEDEYEGDMDMTSVETSIGDPGTVKAIDELVKKANLKKPAQQKKLALALFRAVEINDEYNDHKERERARDVSESFRQAAKLLK